jgi:hypothetical protein
MKTSEVLRKAADEIRRRGWHQGDYGSDGVLYQSCSVCALGAINAVLYNGDPFDGLLTQNSDRHRAVRMLEEIVGGRVHDWNDEGVSTVEEVLEKFEEAARAAEAEGD